MDMMSAALSYAALAAYLALRERRLPQAFLAAFSAVAASGVSHPAGGVLSFCGVSLLAIYLDRRRVSVYCLTLAAIPFVIAAIGWGLFISRHPDYFLLQFGFNITFHKRTSGFSSPVGALRNQLSNVMYFFGVTEASTKTARIKMIRVRLL
jgi:hypothetical protein